MHNCLFPNENSNKLLYDGKTGDKKMEVIAVIKVRSDMTPVRVEIEKKLKQIAK